jgi:hypothetical protein
MKCHTNWGLIHGFAVLAMLTTACAKPATSGGDQAATGNSAASGEDAASEGNGETMAAAGDAAPEGFIASEWAKLSPEDRELVVAQKVCPVSDGPLGGMEGMKKVEVEGRTVFICCEHCEPDLLKDPRKYLAKLDNAAKEAPSEAAPESTESGPSL